jgi:hypothetical protein
VTTKDGLWIVKGETTERAVSVHETKKSALHAAREVAKHAGGQLVVHGRDGRIKDAYVYGHDPYPTRSEITGSYTTKKSTKTLKSNVNRFALALERLAKK